MKENIKKMKVYNLVVLDKSGSMEWIRQSTIEGVNSIIDSIREAQQQFAATQEHYLTLHLFCGCSQSDVYDAAPIDLVRNLTREDYKPCCNTPLYDAIGLSLQKLEHKIAHDRATAVVTIVTDGMENCSRKFSSDDVEHLVSRLREKGWTFAYMGSDHDVHQVAEMLSIGNVHQFEHTQEGTGAGFDHERYSRSRHFDRLNTMMEAEPEMAYDEYVVRLRVMNERYYEPETPLREIFVFGSNAKGMHNGGAALKALSNYGAVFGKAEGLQGNAYAIPTVGVNEYEMRRAVERFCHFALTHDEMLFRVTAIGCGHAGYKPYMVAPLFAPLHHRANVVLPPEFIRVLDGIQ